MKRFIRYLYEYENGKRIRNVGFVKVEAGNEETTLHMQGKGFHESGDQKIVLYLFYEENGEIIGIRQEDIRLTGPVLSYHQIYTANDVGVPGNYSKINGILVETESGRRIAAAWDDRPVDVGRMREFLPQIDDLQMNTLGREDEKTGRSTPENEEMRPEDIDSGREDEKAGHNAPEQQKIRPTEVEISRPQYTKIQRQDISKLPRCEWRLANNQFLIHGYSNYHHLILLEEENVLKLGVPGIYHIKEAEYAEMFGFGEFLSVDELGILSDVTEERTEEQFGYWCRTVRKKRSQ